MIEYEQVDQISRQKDDSWQSKVALENVLGLEEGFAVAGEQEENDVGNHGHWRHYTDGQQVAVGGLDKKNAQLCDTESL